MSVTLTSHAVVTSDIHGTILSVNQSAITLFGYTQQELIGSKVNILMAPPYSEQHDSFMTRYQKTKESQILGKTRGKVTKKITKNTKYRRILRFQFYKNSCFRFK